MVDHDQQTFQKLPVSGSVHIVSRLLPLPTGKHKSCMSVCKFCHLSGKSLYACVVLLNLYSKKVNEKGRDFCIAGHRLQTRLAMFRPLWASFERRIITVDAYASKTLLCLKSSSKSTRSPATYCLSNDVSGQPRPKRRCSNNMLLVNVWICLMIMISQQEPSLKLMCLAGREVTIGVLRALFDKAPVRQGRFGAKFVKRQLFFDSQIFLFRIER